MTGHFTSYETRTNHELTTRGWHGDCRHYLSLVQCGFTRVIFQRRNIRGALISATIAQVVAPLAK